MSQIEVNRAVRLLTSKPLKFTIKIICVDGSEVEVQSNLAPKLDWNSEAREVWVVASAGVESYGNSWFPIMPASKMKMMQMEENPPPA